MVFSNFVRTTKLYLLWEKETKNQREARLTMEVTEKEDRENLQKLLWLLKINLKAKKTGNIFRSFLIVLIKIYFPPKIFPKILPSPPPSFF